MKLSIESIKHGTRINDSEIPEQLRRRISTGISWFDDCLGYGGFVPSNVMMLTGDPGVGKTTFFVQLADSLCKQGHAVLFNTGEQSFVMLKLLHERLGLHSNFYCGTDRMTTDIFAHADSIREKHPNKQFFLLQDSLPTMDDGKYPNGWTNSQTPQRCIEEMVDFSKRTFAVSIFINHVLKSGEFAGKQSVLHTIDQHFSLYFDRKAKSPTFGERMGWMKKNRWGTADKVIILGMAEKSGIYQKGWLEEVT